ncbi:ABC transporter permease [Kribbella sp. NPDC050124]|uniref:ABC transporter permease n=1 Tax=Kribbella sp. NPDC050124 TaxID=3364114 RepID=UPI00378FCFD4
MSVLDGPKTVAIAPAAATAVKRAKRPARRPWPLVAGSVILGLIVVVLLLTPWIAPADPTQQDLTQRLAGPSAEHWLGTDQLGRDLLSRLMYGGRFSVTIAGITVAICAVLGTLVGILCARVRGAFDELVMRVCDVLLAFPEMIVAMFVVSILGASKTTLILALVVGGWTPFAKLARGVAIEVDARGFIEAARALGCSRQFIVLRHLLPNSLNPLMAHAALRFGHKLITVGALSYLGLGVQPPAADWGSMLAAAQPFLSQAPHLVVYPGLAIFVTALSVTMIGQGINARRGSRS